MQQLRQRVQALEQQKAQASVEQPADNRLSATPTSANTNNDEPPNEYLDSITYELMRDPVVLTTSGQTYE